MASGGAYNRHSRMQAVGSIPGVALLEQAAAVVELPDPGAPLVLADYGCSGGRNSLAPVTAAIDVLRGRGNHPIVLAHTDLPDNDFSALFDTVWNAVDSYTSKPDVFPVAIGRSFYHQLLPACSVTLGWCSWSVAWLSGPPAAIPDHVQVSYSDDDAVRSAYSQQAAADWRDFLTARAAEMRAGARLVLVVPAADDDGTAGYRPMFEAAWETLTDLVSDGFLDADEVVRMGMPHVGRTAADLFAPFGDDGRIAGLTIEHLESFTGPDEFWQDYQSAGDAAAFGARWAGIFSAGAFPSLATGLHSTADDPRTTAVLQRLESGIAARLAAAPQPMRIPVINVVIAKTAGDR